MVNLNFWKKDRGDSNQPENEDVEYRYSSDSDENKDSSVVNSPEYYQAEPADPEKAKFYNNISRWALYIGAFLLPLFFLPWTSNILAANKQILLIVIASVGLISWLLGIVSSGNLTWRKNIIDKAVIGFLLATILISVFSMNMFKSIFGFGGISGNTLISIISMTILYFLIVNNTEDKGKSLKSFFGLAVVLALIYGLLQIFGIYIIKFPFAVSKAFNTVGSVNALGVLAAISLPFFSKVSFDLKYIKNIHLEKIGIVLALILLVVLNWWVLWTIAISGMVAMIIFENLGGSRFKMNKLILPMTVVVLGAFMMVVKLDLSALKKDLPVEVAPSFALSKDVTYSVLKENLIFGYGLGNFSIAFDKYGANHLANTTLSDTRFFSATSEAFNLIVEGGLVMVAGMIFLLAYLILLFWRFKDYASKNNDPASLKEDMGVLAALAATLVAFLIYPFNITLMFILYFFMGLSVLAIFYDMRRDFNIEEKASLSLTSSLGFIGGLILALVGVYFGFTAYVGDVKYAQAIGVGENADTAGLLVEAINWNNQDSRYYRSASQTALQLLAEELKKTASAERDARIQNYVTTSISLAKRATEVEPKDALNWANLGLVYQNLLSLVDGVDKLSESAYLEAAKLRPGDPAFSYRIGTLYLAKFDLYTQLVAARRVNPNSVLADAQASLLKAEENLKRTTELSPNFGLAIYNLGVVYEREGKLNDAIKQLEKVAPANNNQPGLAFELGLLYYRAGRKDDALNALKAAVVLAPDYANARWYVALILEERGDIDGAVDQLERILSVDVNKDNKVVLDELTKLRAGKRTVPPEKVLDQQPIQ